MLFPACNRIIGNVGNVIRIGLRRGPANRVFKLVGGCMQGTEPVVFRLMPISIYGGILDSVSFRAPVTPLKRDICKLNRKMEIIIGI